MSTKIPGTTEIPASQLFVDPADIAIGVQRDPEDRINALVNAFGPKGEKFNPDIFGILIAKKRGDKYAIKDGGGRHYAIMNLLKKPQMILPCIISKGDDFDLFAGQNSRVLVAAGYIFWGRGHSDDPRYSYVRRICKILESTREGFTTIPGKKAASIKIANAMFAYDLGVLREALTIADIHWAGPKRKNRIEGIGLTALAAFLALYPDHDAARLDRILQTPYGKLKEDSRWALPKNKEHQRQWGVAVCKELVEKYNRNLHNASSSTGRKLVRLNPDAIMTIQNTLQGHKNFNSHSQIWEMRKSIPVSRYSKKKEKIAA